MKTSLKVLILSTLLPLTGISYAQQPTHQGPMSGDMMGMEHGVGKMDPAKLTEHLKKRQEQMLLIHDLSNKILAEKDPQKQQALKDQQLELMRAHHMEMMSMHHGQMSHEKKQ